MMHKNREITDPEKLREILQKSDVCHVAMIDGDYPYQVPMNYGFEYEDGKLTLYFHCMKLGKKLDVIAKNDHVCFAMDCDHEYIMYDPRMHCTINYESIIGFGRISVVEDIEECRKGLTLLLRHHGSEEGFEMPDSVFRGVKILKIDVESFTGKKKKYIPQTEPAERE